MVLDSKQQSVIQQLNARKGRLIVMCSKGDAASVNVGKSCRVIEVPLVEDCLQPVINIVPLQVCLVVPFRNIICTIFSSFNKVANLVVNIKY